MNLIDPIFFKLKSLETNGYILSSVHSYKDEKRDIRFDRYNLIPLSSNDTYPYFSLILFYNNNKLRFILDNFAFVNDTYLGESQVPKGRNGSYPSNINNIWLYANGRNDFTPTNWSWNEIDDYQTSFYFRPNGKERKSVAKRIQQMTDFFNYVFEDFKKTVEQTVFTNDDW